MHSTLQNGPSAASPLAPRTDELSVPAEGSTSNTGTITVEVAAAAVEALVTAELPLSPTANTQSNISGREMTKGTQRAKNVRKKKNGLISTTLSNNTQVAVETIESSGVDSSAEVEEVSLSDEAATNCDVVTTPESVDAGGDTGEKEEEVKPEVSDFDWATVPSINELGIHIKKHQSLVCSICNIKTFRNSFEFETHHTNHAQESNTFVKLETLDPVSLPPYYPTARAVARKRTLPPVPTPREPIKLTLRLTTGRKAKAAEERQEAARKAEMLTAAEGKVLSPSPTTKEEDVFQKAITDLEITASKTPEQCISPSPNFTLHYSPSPPASSASTDQQGSLPNSRPPSVGAPTISVRTTESLQEVPGNDPSNKLCNVDKNAQQVNVQEPEFVSLERLADTVGLNNASPIQTSTPPAASVIQSVGTVNLGALNVVQTAPLVNLAAMQPSTMLPNLLIGTTMRPPQADPLSTHNASTYSQPTGQSYVCDVCAARVPDSVALESHRALAGHYRCAPCNVIVSTSQDLNNHYQKFHSQMPQLYHPGAVRNPPPLYRGPIVTTPQQFQTNPPPLVFQQQQYRGPYNAQIFTTMPPNQFRAAPPRYTNARLQVAQQQQPTLRHALQQPPLQQPIHNTPVKRPMVPSTNSPPVKITKRPEIPARQPEDCQIIAVQRGGEGVPQIQSVQGSATTVAGGEKPASTLVQLTSEITLSVKPSGDKSKTPQKQNGSNVASLLANRGITVTTSAKNKAASESAARNTPPAQPSAPPAIPESLSMNSSISILPASRNSQQSNGNTFAVPKNRPAPAPAANTPERPPRPPTVDLTSDTVTSRGTQPNKQQGSVQCTVPHCGRIVASAAALQQHMQVHHPQLQNKLPYRCSLCNASYPNEQGLRTHRQQVHKEPVQPPQHSPNDMGIPVVDLRAPGAVERLSRLGIHHYIPLPSQNSGGFFSIPIVSADTARNPSLFSLQALSAASVMPFGPLRALPR